MKRSRSHPAAVTSLPQSPQEEADARVRHYVITMSIRVVCFVLMALVTPYGWYTWVFGIAAAVLPYIAVVFANASSARPREVAEIPQQQLAEDPTAAEPTDATTPPIITVHEQQKEKGA